MFSRQRSTSASLGPRPVVPVANELSTSPEKPKKDGSRSLSSSFKKTFLLGLGKLKSLKGPHKIAKKCNNTRDESHGLSDLDEDHEVVSRLPEGLAPDSKSSEAGVASLLRKCQLETKGDSQFVGNVPVLSMESLRSGLQASSNAVVVIRVGEDPSDLNPAPNSIKHCSTELPHAVQRRIASQAASGSHTNSLGSSRQPSFSRALRKARRESAEGLAAVRNAVRAINAGGRMGSSNGYSASTQRVTTDAQQQVLGLLAGGVPFTVPSNLGAAGVGAHTGGVLALGLASSCSSKEGDPSCLEASICAQRMAALVTLPTRRGVGESGDAGLSGSSVVRAAAEGSSGDPGAGSSSAWLQGGLSGVPQPSAPNMSHGASYPLAGPHSRSCAQQLQQQHPSAPGAPFTSSAMLGAAPPSPGCVTATGPFAGAFATDGRPTVQKVIASAVAGTSFALAPCRSISLGERPVAHPAAPGSAAAPTMAPPEELRAASSLASPPPAGGLGSFWLAGGMTPINSSDDRLLIEDPADAEDSIIGVLESDKHEGAVRRSGAPPCSSSNSVHARQTASHTSSSTFGALPAFGSRVMAGGSASANDITGAHAASALVGSMVPWRTGTETGLHSPSSSGGLSSFGPSLAGAGARSQGGSATNIFAAESCVLPISPFAPTPLPMGPIAEAARGSSSPAHRPMAALAAPAVASAVAVGPPGVPVYDPPRVDHAVGTAAAEGVKLPSVAAAVAAAKATATNAVGGFGSMAGFDERVAAPAGQPAQPTAASAAPPQTGSGPYGVGSGATGSRGCGANGDEGDASGGSETDLEVMYVSTAVEQLMGTAEPAQLRLTLYMLLSNNPSLQLILEGIIRSAMAGRVVVHEQLVACPRRLQSGGTGPTTAAWSLSSSPTGTGATATAAALGSVTGVVAGDGRINGFGSGTGRYPASHSGSGALLDLAVLAPQRQQPHTQPVSRNPLDDFLLLQVTACYLDYQAGSANGPPQEQYQQQQQQPPLRTLPALFIAFSRPYATAVSSAAAAASKSPSPSTAAVGDSLPLLVPPHDTRLALPASRCSHQGGSPLSRTSLVHPKAGVNAGACISGATDGGITKSPSLGSFLGSLGRPNWVRPGSALAGSPGPSPKPHRSTLGPQHNPLSRHAVDPAIAVHHAEGALPYCRKSGSSTAVGVSSVLDSCADGGNSLQAAGGLQTAVTEASAAATLEGLCGHLRLEQTLLAHVPMALTVLTLDGRVLYQNGRSVAFLGNAVGAPIVPKIDVTDPEHTLQKIFCYDAPALDSMWDAIQSGKTWSGLVCMPPQVELAHGDSSHTSLSGNRAALGVSPDQRPWSGGGLVAGVSSLMGSDTIDMDVVGQLLQKLQPPGSSSLEPRVNTSSLGCGPTTGAPGPSLNRMAGTAGSGNCTDTGNGGGAGLGSNSFGFGHASNAPAALGSPVSPQDGTSGHERRSVLGLRAALSRATDPMVAFNAPPACDGGVARAAVNLPRNISAPSFRGGAGNACPLPSVREAEVSGGTSGGGISIRATAGIGLDAGTAAGNDLAAVGRRISWNSLTQPWGQQSGTLYGSSPLAGASPLSAAASLAGAGALPLHAPSQHLPGSRRTRLHRSNSLAQTEVALGGSYRAMRLAASALSQGLLGPGPAGLTVGAGGCGGGSWSIGSGEGLQSCSPLATDMPSPGAGAKLGDVLVTASPSGRDAGTLQGEVGARAGMGVAGSASSASGPRCGGCGGGGGGGGGGLGPPSPGGSAGGARSLLQSPVGSHPGVPVGAGSQRSGPRTDDIMRTGSVGGPAAALACYFGACCWHEIQANLVLDAVTLEWNLVLVNHDVTTYVQAEMEVRQVLDAEHRILEECFPRHVLEVMTSDKRRASAFGAASALAPGNGSPFCSTSLAARHTTSLPLPSSNGRGCSSLQSGTLSLDHDATDGRPSLPPSAAHVATAGTAAVVPLMYENYRRRSSPMHGAQSRPIAVAAAVGAVNGANMATAALGAAAAAAPGRALASSLLQGAFQQVPAANNRVTRSFEGSLAGPTIQGASAATPGTSHASTLPKASCDQRSASTHLGASSSLASFNHSSYMTNATHGTYDTTCDDSTSFSQNLHGGGDVSALGGGLAHLQLLGGAAAAAASAAATLSPLPRHLQLRGSGAASGPAVPAPYSLASNSLSVTTPFTPTWTGGVATMSGSQQYMARSHEEVTVLFADIASFTSMCGEVEPQQVMAFLNDLFTTFDQLVEKHQVYKVETIGDCYMVCGGLVEEDAEGFRSVTENVDPFHAHKVFAFAADMLQAARSVLMPGSGLPVQLRVGIHSGPVMSGIVGRKMPRFCLFGDTVNVASRMESTGVPGAVHISSSSRALLGSIADGFMPTGGMPVKGKGYMYTYLYDPLGCAAKHLAARQQSQPVS